MVQRKVMKSSALELTTLEYAFKRRTFSREYLIGCMLSHDFISHISVPGYFETTLLAEPFLTVHMLCTEKRLCTNPVKFLLSMLSALLSNSFEPRPNRCSFLTVSFRRTFRRHFYLLPAGSVSIIGFSQKFMLALEKPV